MATTQIQDTSCDSTEIERRYYLAMTAPFVVDVVITTIFTTIAGLPEILLRNVAMAALILLLMVHLGARHLFRPVKAYIAGEKPFDAIERVLTQLPLRSAVWVSALYLPILLFRLVLPLVVDLVAPGVYMVGMPRLTWADALATALVQTVFAFVLIYFLISAYLERLCRHLFELRGVNLGLFFGRYSFKIGVALVFSSLAPLLLVAIDVASYDGEQLMREAAIDLTAAGFGIFITLYWVTRTLTRPIARLDAGMRQVADGSLDVRLPVTSNEEIGQLTAHFNRMTEGLRERQRIRETFGKYVSESVASALLQGSVDGRLRAEHGTATLMFTDIEGFTPLSTHVDPATLVEIMNEYLALVVEPIQRHGGVVNSFIGDGLFASFNMPLANADHAAAAIRAAQEITARLDGHGFKGGIKLRTRIGLNTGPVIGGTVGAGERLSYTLLGDAVNVAARLEELNKQHGTRILLSATTKAAAGDGFAFRPVGDAVLRGRTDSLAIFTLDSTT